MSYRVLIIDDSTLIRRTLKRSFEEANFTVLEAANGQTALEIAAITFDIDLIFTDIHMDEMDGFTLIEGLKKMEHLARVPIFVLSADQTEDSKSRAKALGVTACLVKPWNATKVLPFLKRLLSANESPLTD